MHSWKVNTWNFSDIMLLPYYQNEWYICEKWSLYQGHYPNKSKQLFPVKGCLNRIWLAQWENEGKKKEKNLIPILRRIIYSGKWGWLVKVDFLLFLLYQRSWGYTFFGWFNQNHPIRLKLVQKTKFSGEYLIFTKFS